MGAGGLEEGHFDNRSAAGTIFRFRARNRDLRVPGAGGDAEPRRISRADSVSPGRPRPRVAAGVGYKHDWNPTALPEIQCGSFHARRAARDFTSPPRWCAMPRAARAGAWAGRRYHRARKLAEQELRDSRERYARALGRGGRGPHGLVRGRRKSTLSPISQENLELAARSQFRPSMRGWRKRPSTR